jgi:hypothetical protein
VLSEHKLDDSSNESSIIYVCARKKKKTTKAKSKKIEMMAELLDFVSYPSVHASASDEDDDDTSVVVDVVVQVSTVQEVETQDLPEMAAFGEYTSEAKAQ